MTKRKKDPELEAAEKAVIEAFGAKERATERYTKEELEAERSMREVGASDEAIEQAAATLAQLRATKKLVLGEHEVRCREASERHDRAKRADQRELTERRIAEIFDRLEQPSPLTEALPIFLVALDQSVALQSEIDELIRVAERDGGEFFGEFVDARCRSVIESDASDRIKAKARQVLAASVKSKRILAPGKAGVLRKMVEAPAIELNRDQRKLLEQIVERRSARTLRPKSAAAKAETETEIEERLLRDKENA